MSWVLISEYMYMYLDIDLFLLRCHICHNYIHVMQFGVMQLHFNLINQHYQNTSSPTKL